MSLGKLVVGLASLVMGAQGLKNGMNELSGAVQSPRSSRRPPPRRVRGRGVGDVAPAVPMQPAASAFLSPGAPAFLPEPATRPMPNNTGLTAEEQLVRMLRTAKVRTLAERLRYIQGRVDVGMRNPKMYALARHITSEKVNGKWAADEKDTLAEAQLIYRYLRGTVRYTSDSLGLDVFQNPALTVGLHAGDCDDYSSLGATLLMHVGIPVKMKVIQTVDSREPNHIYLIMNIPKGGPQWVPFDASVEARVGWEAPAKMVAKKWLFNATTLVS